MVETIAGLDFHGNQTISVGPSFQPLAGDCGEGCVLLGCHFAMALLSKWVRHGCVFQRVPLFLRVLWVPSTKQEMDVSTNG